MFAVLKIQHLLIRKNPAITEFTDTSAIKNEDTFEISENEGFQVAVGLKNYKKGMRNDPRYVQWVARSYKQTGPNEDQIFYPMHVCSPSDLDKFYPVQQRSTNELQKMVDQNGLFCLDWQGQNIASFFGHWRTDQNYHSVDIMAVPCLMRFKGPDGIVIEPRDDCVWEKDDVMDYLGDTVQIQVYNNQEKFHSENFGEERVQQSSTISVRQVNAHTAHFIEAFVQQQELSDETQILQLGQLDSVKYQDFVLGLPGNSIYDDWPTPANPEGDYKIVGVWVELSQSMIIVER